MKHQIHPTSLFSMASRPENVLLDHTGHVKLSDMGCAKFATNSTYTVVGTPDYFSPEMVKVGFLRLFGIRNAAETA